MRSSSRCLAVLALALASGACDVASFDNRRDGGKEADTPVDVPGDTSGDSDTGGVVLCDPKLAETGCPEGMDCHTLAKVCTECVATTSRCRGGKRETCLKPEALATGVVEGGFFEPDPCAKGEACVASAFDATCQPVICQAAETRCVAGRQETCDATGTRIDTKDCPSGHACYGGRCQPIRHNVLLVFDTSGSMNNYIAHPGSPLGCVDAGTPCLQDFPVCDDPQAPLTLLTLAKQVFADTLQASVGGFVQFALQRFPQKEGAWLNGNCQTGWYLPIGTMTGDDGTKDTASPAGAWFDAAFSEAVVVPFPTRDTMSNSASLVKWLDHVETLGPTDQGCVADVDCHGGRCILHEGRKVCEQHADPELRGGGQTPLGKSLFYAGEYFRRHVVIDGRPCAKDLDCPSSGYICDDGACRDPYRHCKDNYVVLFTDGEETAFPDETLFFNPAIQAKRLAHGLGCAEDADCRGGATCQAGRCLAPGQTPANVPTFVDPDGFQALSAPDGSPLSVRVSVVTLQASSGTSFITANQRIATSGGGAHLDVHADEPEAMRAKLIEIMALKAKCKPEDL